MQVTWKIDWLKCKNQQDSYANIVISAGWSAKLIDEKFTSEVNGVCSFSDPINNFINYDNLKELDVLNWCWDSGVNKNEIELFLQNDINVQKSPTIRTTNIPWN